MEGKDSSREMMLKIADSKWIIKTIFSSLFNNVADGVFKDDEDWASSIYKAPLVPSFLFFFCSRVEEWKGVYRVSCMLYVEMSIVLILYRRAKTLLIAHFVHMMIANWTRNWKSSVSFYPKELVLCVSCEEKRVFLLYVCVGNVRIWTKGEEEAKCIGNRKVATQKDNSYTTYAVITLHSDIKL